LRPTQKESKVVASPLALRCPTLAITGSEKRGDEGTPLFSVRVDGAVMPRFHSSKWRDQSLFLKLSQAVILNTLSSLKTNK
jgi:hypothetical protein